MTEDVMYPLQFLGQRSDFQKTFQCADFCLYRKSTISLRCRLMQTIHFQLNVAAFIKMYLWLSLSFQTHKLVTDAQRKYF